MSDAGLISSQSRKHRYKIVNDESTIASYIQAYNDVFYIMACFLFIAVLAVLFIRKPPEKASQMSPARCINHANMAS